jgi:membrane-bound lytic murein transglycosylase A
MSASSRIAQILSILVITLNLWGCSSSGLVSESGSTSSHVGDIALIKGFYPTASKYIVASWSQLPGWTEDQLTQAWPAWQNSCRSLMKGRDQLNWKRVCARTIEIKRPSNAQIREFFEENFRLYEIRQAQAVNKYPVGSNQGMITGYYEPEIKGSKKRQGIYQTPLHTYPESWKKNKKDKYPTRQQLMTSGELNGLELAWVADPVAAAFMQIQGSGKILLETGEVLRLGFAGTNEQPFKSFAQWLIDKKEMSKANASMQSIQEWARKNPDRVTEMLNANPRYVFFKNISSQDGPIGAIGVPLIAQRSIAVDWNSIPQGAPVYLSTTYPNSSSLLQRLVFAQDTGVAIVGGVRADFYWGSGDAAAEKAGGMKQVGRMWVLLPQ